MDFAGGWYPAGRESCQREIEAYWREAGEEPERRSQGARLGVVPHAGWMYSGRLAARVFQRLADDPVIELVVVLGGHLRRSDPIVAMAEGTWDTPFGPFAIHGGFAEHLQKLEPVRYERDGRYEPDNSTELQLPFAKFKYPEAELLPLRVPPGPAALALGHALEEYLRASGLAAVVIASTDLTHYGPHYGFTPKGYGHEALHWVRAVNDPAFVHAVERGDPEAVLAMAEQRRCACSAGAVAAVSAIAARRGLRFQTLDYATSADVAGEDAENFVGYLAGVYL
jgi:AmmeMemoRadiSam system protein B